MMRQRKTKDAVEILRHDMGSDPAFRAQVEEEKLNARVAQLIYDARTSAGLTQHALAEMIGTTQSVIARLEDADYEGHSLTTLQRIAEALGKRLSVSFKGLEEAS